MQYNLCKWFVYQGIFEHMDKYPDYLIWAYNYKKSICKDIRYSNKRIKYYIIFIDVDL